WGGDNHAHLLTNQVGSQCRQAIIIILRPSILDRHIAVFDEAAFPKSIVEDGQTTLITPSRACVQETDHEFFRLLCACRVRPHCRSTDKNKELSPPHSMTSSARASSAGGMVRPSAFAVLGLSVLQRDTPRPTVFDSASTGFR